MHTNAFTHKRSYTHTLLHTEALTHRSFDTETPSHTDAFTHRSFYTQTLLHTEAFTHLVRNILSNYWCGTHRSCKNNSVKPDMSHWMISSEKLCEGNHMSRSDAAQTCSRLRQQKIENCKLTTGRFLGWASPHFWKRMQVRAVDQTAYPLQTSVASLATDWWMEPWPPAKLEVLHLYRWFTHTPPPAGGWEIKVPTMRWKWRGREMKMRWRWQWDESYLTRTQRGERKRRGKEETPTHET